MLNSLQAQGQVLFQNNPGTLLTNLAGTPFPPAGSSAYAVGLYWGTFGTPEASLQLLPASSNGVTRGWVFDGLFWGGVATFPIQPATQIELQVRFWSGSYSSYEDAISNDPSAVAAKGMIQLITLGNAGFQIPTPPTLMYAPDRLGDTAFRGFLVPVPEPTALILLAFCSAILATRAVQHRRRTT